MSLFRNTTSHELAPLEAGLSRVALACQFNFPEPGLAVKDFQTKGGRATGGESSLPSAAHGPASNFENTPL
jgi:hypothetical protein